jgi:hypothetical protein
MWEETGIIPEFEWMRKTLKNFYLDILSPGQNLNQGFHRCEA